MDCPRARHYTNPELQPVTIASKIGAISRDTQVNASNGWLFVVQQRSRSFHPTIQL